VVEPFERHGPQRLVEVAGGRMRSFPLPAGPGGHLYWRDDWRWQLASERGRPDSVLLAGSDLWTGAFRLYRVDESGHIRLLFERRQGAGATIASSGAGGVLPVVGLERYDRISLISIATGSVADVGRSFRNVVSVAAGDDGKIFAFAYDFVGGRLTVYTLVGGAAAGQPARELAPGAFSFPSTSGPPALWIEHQSEGYRTTVVTVRTDGTRFRRLVEHASVLPFCPSVDGREVAFASDRSVPTEPWTYVARSGTAPVKISERADWTLCPFDAHWLVTWRGATEELDRRDLRSGRLTVIARHIPFPSWALSPDGMRLAYVRNGVLTTVELATLARRTVATNASEPVWSPDSRRLAYLAGGRALRVDGSSFHVRFANETPSFSWSPDGARLLVCLARTFRAPGCQQGDGSAATLTPHERLLLADVRTGAVREVAAGAIVYADWSPAGAYAYATTRTLRIVEPDGRARSFPARILGGDGSWLGFSPDGRWFGFLAGTSEKWPRGIAVLDTRTGRSRLLRPLGPGRYSAGWWR
jgi:WD40-like Beta Propeller Repeat